MIHSWLGRMSVNQGLNGVGGERAALLVDLTTGFKCPFGGSTVNINVGLRPGYDTTRQSFGAAGSQVVDLPWGEFSIPDVEMGQFSHKCLGGIKSTAKSILEERN